MNWLDDFAHSDDGNYESELERAINELSEDDLREMSIEFMVDGFPTEMDEMSEKMAEAHLAGAELARVHGDELQKAAMLPLIGTIASGLAAGAVKGAVTGGAKTMTNAAHGVSGAFKYAGASTMLSVAKHGLKRYGQLMAGGMKPGVYSKSTIWNKRPGNHPFKAAKDVDWRQRYVFDMEDATRDFKPHGIDHSDVIGSYRDLNDAHGYRHEGMKSNLTRALTGAGIAGGTLVAHKAKEKKANIGATLGQKVVGGLVRHPGIAMPLAGAVGGAMMAGRDPQTGQKNYLRGALTGAALGVGANVSGATNYMRHAVLNPKNPILGQGVANYARQATKATGPAAMRAASQVAPAAATASKAVPPVQAATPKGSQSFVGVPKLDTSMLTPIEGGAAPYKGGPVSRGAVQKAPPQLSKMAPPTRPMQRQVAPAQPQVPMAAAAPQGSMTQQIDAIRAHAASGQGAGHNMIVPGSAPSREKMKLAPAGKDTLLRQQDDYLKVLKDKNPEAHAGLKKIWDENAATKKAPIPAPPPPRKSPVQAADAGMGTGVLTPEQQAAAANMRKIAYRNTANTRKIING